MENSKIAIIGNQAFTLLKFRGPLIKRLIDKGYRIYALAPEFSPKLKRQVEDLGATPIEVSMSRSGMNPFRDLMDMVGLYKILKDLEPSLCLTYFTKPVIYGNMAAQLCNISHRFSMIEGAGYVFNDEAREGIRSYFLRKIVKNLYKIALNGVSNVFVLNEDDEELFIQENILSKEKIVRIPGIGIDTQKYNYSEPDTSPVSFILVARLIEEKGVNEFIEAGKRIKKNYPDRTRFILVGGVDDNPSTLTREYLEGLNEENIIEWVGHVPDVRPWLKKSSVFVLPSYYREGMPRSILEAMSMGRPIITTDWVGCKETVEEGENGFLVPIKNSEKLVKRMIYFVKNPKKIKTMGDNSRAMVLNKFDVNNVNDLILDTMNLG